MLWYHPRGFGPWMRRLWVAGGGLEGGIEKNNRFYYPYEALKEYFLLRKYRKYMGNIYLTTNPK